MAEFGHPLRARVLRSPLGRTLFGPLVTRRGLGLLVMLFSAASIGAVTPFARLALDAGVSVAAIMTMRYGLALLAVIGYMAWRRQPWRLRGRRLWQTLAVALALGASAFAYIGSVRHIPVSVAVLIFYMYPILVSLLSYAIEKQRHSKEDRKAHIIAFGGQSLSLGGLVLLFGIWWTSLRMAGVLMAAASAIAFALVVVFAGRLMRIVPPMVLNLYVALLNTALFMAIGMLGGGAAWPTDGVGWLGLAGAAAFFVMGFLGFFVGVNMLGPSRAACLSNFEPVVTIALSITLLGEPYGPWQFIGAGVVLTGIFAMCRTLWREDSLYVLRQAHARFEAIDLADCTPICRSGSQCLLAEPVELRRRGRLE